MPRHDAAWWAARTRGYDWLEEDKIDTPAFNRLLWQGLAPGRPYPATRSGKDLKPVGGQPDALRRFNRRGAAARRSGLSPRVRAAMSARPLRFRDPPDPMPLLRFLPDNTKINFVGARYFAFAIDGLLLLATIVSIALRGLQSGHRFHRRRAPAGEVRSRPSTSAMSAARSTASISATRRFSISARAPATRRSIPAC